MHRVREGGTVEPLFTVSLFTVPLYLPGLIPFPQNFHKYHTRIRCQDPALACDLMYSLHSQRGTLSEHAMYMAWLCIYSTGA